MQCVFSLNAPLCGIAALRLCAPLAVCTSWHDLMCVRLQVRPFVLLAVLVSGTECVFSPLARLSPAPLLCRTAPGASSNSVCMCVSMCVCVSSCACVCLQWMSAGHAVCPVCKAAISRDTLIPLYARGGSASTSSRYVYRTYQQCGVYAFA